MQITKVMFVTIPGQKIPPARLNAQAGPYGPNYEVSSQKGTTGATKKGHTRPLWLVENGSRR
jgi:hypothetical protein